MSAKNQDHAQRKTAIGLNALLADTYMLYNSTQECHWNVEGPQFRSLHQLFEEEYREMAEAIDVIAERVRTMGYYTSGSLPEILEHSRIRYQGGLRRPEQMLSFLIEGHQQVTHRIRELQSVAEDAMDEGTIDLLNERLRVHEKTLWMLKSQAGRSSDSLVTRPSLTATG